MIQNHSQATVPTISNGNQLFCIWGTCLRMSSLDQAQIPPHRYIRILQSHSCRSHFHKDYPRNIHRYLQVTRGGDKVRGDTVGSDSDTTFNSVLVCGSALSCLVHHSYKEGMCVPYNHRFRPGVCPCSTAEKVRDLSA